MLSDFRLALRMLRKTPFVTATAVVSLPASRIPPMVALRDEGGPRVSRKVELDPSARVAGEAANSGR